MTSASISQIDGKIAEATKLLTALDNEAAELSLPIVEGDQNAVSALADIRRKAAQVRADLTILEHARAGAIKRDADADDEAAAAYRAEHLEAAKAKAAELVRLGGKADQLSADLKTLLVDMAEAERALWRELTEAKAQPTDPVVGRKGLAQIVVDQVSAVITGLDKFRGSKPIAVTAAVAWADLLEGSADE
jgi:hypothetical protein